MKVSLEYLTGFPLETVSEIVHSNNLHYRSYKIRKANKVGYRYIDAPDAQLKLIQRNLIRNFFSKAEIAEESHGFTYKKSAVTNAKKHLGNNILLSIDIENFFPSIKVKYVPLAIMEVMRTTGIFLEKPEFKLLVKLVTYLDKLPQGAPTSPVISNIILSSLDKKLSTYFAKDNLVYTRYADDITLSHSDKNFDFISSIVKIQTELEEFDLKINKRKTKILKRNKRMSVTGVVINDKLGTPRWYWRNLKAEMHNIIKENLKITQKKASELSGKISWVYTLNPKRGEKLKNLLSKIQLEN